MTQNHPSKQIKCFILPLGRCSPLWETHKEEPSGRSPKWETRTKQVNEPSPKWEAHIFSQNVFPKVGNGFFWLWARSPKWGSLKDMPVLRTPKWETYQEQTGEPSPKWETSGGEIGTCFYRWGTLIFVQKRVPASGEAQKTCPMYVSQSGKHAKIPKEATPSHKGTQKEAHDVFPTCKNVTRGACCVLLTCKNTQIHANKHHPPAKTCKKKLVRLSQLGRVCKLKAATLWNS